jgi:O-antigen/teichoic acid export membrane protein
MESNKIINNAKWIIVCKIAQSLLQLIIGMFSARYLGPANYGLINYAGSIVAFMVPLTQLGLNATLVRELIDYPDEEGTIMGTSMVMGVISSVCCVAMVAGFVSVTNPTEPQTLIVCVLYSLCLIFRAIELIQYWFHGKLKAKYPSIMMVCAYVLVSVYKIYLLISQKDIFWFAVVHAIEYGIVGLGLLVIYGKQSVQKLSFSRSVAVRLFKRSKYYILSSMMVTAFQNTDHIMLKMISGDAENGIYSAAITCAGVCQFIYTAIIDSMRPAILTAKKNGSPEYEKNISRLYGIVIYMAIFQAVGYTVFANLIVRILYGAQYMGAASVLRVLVWYVMFSFMGSVRNIWILSEGKQSILWKINLLGALANIIINMILIPQWGAVGAASASLLTQFFTNFILGFLIPSMRANNKLLMAGMHPGNLIKMLRKSNK